MRDLISEALQLSDDAGSESPTEVYKINLKKSGLIGINSIELVINAHLLIMYNNKGGKQ